ncbi:hypothetical protein EPIR_2725 [Erwinia piriflorinigrans CFBP 5888]|uniref:Uncharacterized protein n=1 Tax=Erwinia piriflorinigrans CFBP 5888 TaxID=1161919 RepID=V5Z9Q6_9GAMM|nr:hypothetical protein EPIR_2725 [Erwinia piriflorinigrans CFBP 5888]
MYREVYLKRFQGKLNQFGSGTRTRIGPLLRLLSRTLLGLRDYKVK